MRIRLFFVLATLFTVPAFAQGICAGGITDPYFAPQFAPNNVSIHWETAQYVFFSNSYLPLTNVGVLGHNITVIQTAPEVGPPQGWVPPACGSGSALLGNLPPGRYNVTWIYMIALVSQPVATYHFVLDVPSDVPIVVGRRVSFSEYRQPSRMFAAVPPLVPGSPVRLVVNFAAAGQWTIAAPTATIRGNAIAIEQTVTRGGSDEMALYLLDFGALPNGTYHVAMTQTVVDGANTYPATESRAFIVQSPPPSAPCGNAPPESSPTISVTRTSAGTAHLHFEESRKGYAPAYGPPSVVDVNSAEIDVEQPLADTFDYEQPGAPAFHETCHAEDIDLGALAAGTYRLWWSPIATLGGSGPYSLGGGGTFIWSGDEMLCSSTPAFSAFGALVSLKRVAWARPFATAFAVNGNAIAVTDSINTEPPPPPGGPRPQCVNTSAALGTLLPGDYIVNWYVVDIGARNIPELLGTYPFTVLRPRSRAARH